MEYDRPVPSDACHQIRTLFAAQELMVEKKSKNGTADQIIIPMIQSLTVSGEGQEICLDAVVCCQNPSLNPMQLSAAIARYLPELASDHVCCQRLEIYDTQNNVFR